MDDPRLADVEQYHGRLRSELDVIARGPVLVGPKIIEHIYSLITLIDLHQPNEFDLCLSCDRLWPCASIVAITGISPDAPDSDEDVEGDGRPLPGAEQDLPASRLAPMPPPKARILPLPVAESAPSPLAASDGAGSPDEARYGDIRAEDPRPTQAHLADPRPADPTFDNQRQIDPRHSPRYDDARPTDTRPAGPRYDEPRYGDARYDDARPTDTRPAEHRYDEARYDDRARYDTAARYDEAGLHDTAGRQDERRRDDPRHDDGAVDGTRRDQRRPVDPPDPAAAPQPRYPAPQTPAAAHVPTGPAIPSHISMKQGIPPQPQPPAHVPPHVPAAAHNGAGPQGAGPQGAGPQGAGPQGPPRAPAGAGTPRSTGAVPRLPSVTPPTGRPAAAPDERPAGRPAAPDAARPAGAPPTDAPRHPAGPPQGPPPGYAPAAANIAGGPGTQARPSAGQPRATGAYPIAGESGRERPVSAGAGLPGLSPPGMPPTRPAGAGDVPPRPTGAHPRIPAADPAAADGRRGHGQPDPAMPAPSLDRGAPPRYPDGTAVPASRPVPPISGPVELAAQADLAAVRAGEGWPGQRYPGDAAARTGGPDGRGMGPGGSSADAPFAGNGGPPGWPGRGGAGDGARAAERAGPPAGAAPVGGRSPYSPSQAERAAAAPDDRRGGHDPRTGAAHPGRGPIGTHGSGVPNAPRRAADQRPPGGPSHAEPARRPAPHPDDLTMPAQPANNGLSPAAARIEQGQVDEVTQAWLARRGSVLDGIDVI
ncbi:hypothetical protein [Frankia canadensis]|nr:hypothetical protein [Frankia canadensis]